MTEPDPYETAIRLLEMIHELHRAGYQRVRFSSGMAPSGLHWRCAITHTGNISDDGLRVLNHSLADDVAHYSTGSLDRYFNWPDAEGRPAKELAALFVQRFSQIVRKGAGDDPAYADWLIDLLGRVDAPGRTGLPVYFADYPIEIEPRDRPPPVRAEPRWRKFWRALRGGNKGDRRGLVGRLRSSSRRSRR